MMILLSICGYELYLEILFVVLSDDFVPIIYYVKEGTFSSCGLIRVLVREWFRSRLSLLGQLTFNNLKET